MDRLVFFFAASLILSVDSLSCDCDYQNRDVYCGPVPTCASPLVYDACGCCQVCSKNHGEECGGPWGIYGKCSPGLECKTKTGADQLGAGGIFDHIRVPKGTCLQPGEVMQTTQPCFIAMKTYQNKYESGHNRAKRQATAQGTTMFTATTPAPYMSTTVISTGHITSDRSTKTTDNKQTTTIRAITGAISLTASVKMTTYNMTTTPCPIKPKCTPEGWFAPTQCDPCTGECWCVPYNTGVEIPNTRTQGRVQCK